MQKVSERAYAKINLSLDILGVREDGYHEVKMVMQSVGMYDLVTAARAPGITIKTNVAYLPLGEENLAHRAARLFFGKTGIKGGAEIEIRKYIPVGAGLAGGSSDAAATLKALNRLYNAGLSLKKLCEIGGEIGADVPYCVLGGTRLAEGIGEKLSPLGRLPDCSVLLVKPSFSISTKWAYERFDSQENAARPDTCALICALERGDLKKVCESMGNVLERVGAGEYPVLNEIRERLMSLGALAAQMSGSGPTMFGIFDDADKAAAAREALLGDYRTVFLCRPV